MMFQSSKLKAQSLFSLKRGKRDLRALSFELSKMTPQWDWLKITSFWGELSCADEQKEEQEVHAHQTPQDRTRTERCTASEQQVGAVHIQMASQPKMSSLTKLTASLVNQDPTSMEAVAWTPRGEVVNMSVYHGVRGGGL